MKWLNQVCKVLENQKYTNIDGVWIEKNDNKEVIGACALGELLLSSNCIQQSNELKSMTIRRALIKYYKVPVKIVEKVFSRINHLNGGGKSKKQIAKILRKEYALK